MASNGVEETFAVDNVLEAMKVMRSGANENKKQAADYLSRFQKSKAAWTTTISILQSSTEAEAQLFAATTLKGKITYDLATQVPEGDHPALRGQILLLLKKYAPGPKPVRVQLCVCLAILAIQMQSWKDVLSTVVSTLGNDVTSHACILDFLRVLPEEVTEGRKITLSEEELTQRTSELLGDNAQQVVELLIVYAQSSPAAATNPQLFDCISSWLREVPVGVVVNSTLMAAVLHGMTNDNSLLAAADCLTVICRETKEVDDNRDTIALLLPKLLELRPRIQALADEGDTEGFKAITRVFAEAGESWALLVARDPQHFRPIVDCLLECCARDKDKDVLHYTFNFWYELKQYLTLEHYIEARVQLVDVFAQLVDILLKQLEYPESDDPNDVDLFDGDREAEEKFREFRHHMGDTLKDSCEVMGVSACLTKVHDAIKLWQEKFGGLATPTSVPHWQSLEAPLFAMRAMGRMVDNADSSVLPQIFPLLVQIPVSNEKLRFAAIMVFGRYTEWTAAHPEFLEPQFQYIVSSFQTDSQEILRAAAQSFKYFCTDCKTLLSEQVIQLQAFYDGILDKLPMPSKEEVTEGVAVVLGVQNPKEIYSLLKLYCDPLINRLMVKANQATDEKSKVDLADHINLLTNFAQYVVPYIPSDQENPAVKYWQEVFPILSTILDNFITFIPICERVCRCWRNMVISYRTAITPLLGPLANKLAEGFAASKQGCFLWATSAVLREFSEDREHVEEGITDNIYVFFEAQATNVLRTMSDIKPIDLPDVIEDFYRLLIDALLYYPTKLIPSPLFTPIFQAAISALSLEKQEPVSAALHYIRDLLTYGGPNPAASGDALGTAGPQLRQIVKQLLLEQGGALIKQTMAGMMFTFPSDCFADGSGVLLYMFQLLPRETAAWVESTIQMLPPGTVTPLEANRLLSKIREKLSGSDSDRRQIRILMQDFTNTYRRRYVAPRDGLGQLEATQFHFSG
ncbi:putative mRNA transport regulator MTR10 [Triangularia verruculosa]|uniref:mRNA transport regulator MTR10 n=1 Tax=Triangularia verruculosa TaxID=2587418 RepID=A0AAN6XFR9_9PEZI|nr:putative mRNA transport regulator MTR10 [Triangularia verruculosa]